MTDLINAISFFVRNAPKEEIEKLDKALNEKESLEDKKEKNHE